ncbi:hypothetical protein SK128_011202, partial [Halocaridina rubra]
MLVNDMVGLLDNTACGMLLPAVDLSPDSLSLYNWNIRAIAHLPIFHCRNTERPLSVTIQHYNHIFRPYKYRRCGHLVRWHNAVSARLPLRFRPVWQVGGGGDIPQYLSCKLCDTPNANNLQPDCLECLAVADLRPHRQSVIEVY